MKAGRVLVRALVVVGGAAAVSAIAWLTATASASTVTQVTDGSASPAVVTTIGDPQPPALVTDSVPVVRRAHDAAAPVLARVRDLSGAAAPATRLTEVLETSVTRAVRAVPGTVVAVQRIAGTATALTGLVAPAEGARDYVEQPPAGPDAARRDDPTRTPANGGPRERSAGLSPAAIPNRVATTAIASQLPADHRSGHGVDGLGGRSWLPSCVGPASAGLTADHDRSCGDAVQSAAAGHPQSSHRRTGVLSRPVASAEIQPGVTPD
ncbi:hypothetical protein [Amycolatopsis sp. cmx-4-68]|uniref:hypothetical protein n=1 Tax=Amycolatopsis sp. cmx-4-68 TaxID=2790938 RepID=UPI003978ECAA